LLGKPRHTSASARNQLSKIFFPLPALLRTGEKTHDREMLQTVEPERPQYFVPDKEHLPQTAARRKDLLNR
jgi:hypothetical protein